MKDKHKRTILRLELEGEAKDKEIEQVKGKLWAALDGFNRDLEKALKAVAHAKAAVAAAEAARADQKILLDEAVGAVKQSIIEAEEARDERDGVQTENEELRQTLSREREDWSRERSGLEFLVSEAES